MCSKDTEIEILRERVQEYRDLLRVAYYMMRSPVTLTKESVEKFKSKLDDHDILPSPVAEEQE